MTTVVKTTTYLPLLQLLRELQLLLDRLHQLTLQVHEVELGAGQLHLHGIASVNTTAVLQGAVSIQTTIMSTVMVQGLPDILLLLFYTHRICHRYKQKAL